MPPSGIPFDPNNHGLPSETTLKKYNKSKNSRSPQASGKVRPTNHDPRLSHTFDPIITDITKILTNDIHYYVTYTETVSKAGTCQKYKTHSFFTTQFTRLLISSKPSYSNAISANKINKSSPKTRTKQQTPPLIPAPYTESFLPVPDPPLPIPPLQTERSNDETTLILSENPFLTTQDAVIDQLVNYKIEFLNVVETNSAGTRSFAVTFNSNTLLRQYEQHPFFTRSHRPSEIMNDTTPTKFYGLNMPPNLTPNKTPRHLFHLEYDQCECTFYSTVTEGPIMARPTIKIIAESPAIARKLLDHNRGIHFYSHYLAFVSTTPHHGQYTAKLAIPKGTTEFYLFEPTRELREQVLQGRCYWHIPMLAISGQTKPHAFIHFETEDDLNVAISTPIIMQNELLPWQIITPLTRPHNHWRSTQLHPFHDDATNPTTKKPRSSRKSIK